MAGGQALDLDAVGIDARSAGLEYMHGLKTGALIGAAVRLGAACGSSLDHDQLVALDRYAGAIGLAFQVIDDVLDVEGTDATLGKTAGKDAAQGKPTYVALLGIDGARTRVRALHAEANAALAAFGPAARRLREVATWITTRDR
jgi:farnesyl diphosphate synthase